MTQKYLHYVLMILRAEFLLGEDILVAPILTKGARKRDVYLPAGIWLDMNKKHSTPIRGPTWLRGYPAELDVLPFFQRVSGESLESTHQSRSKEKYTSTIDDSSYDSFLIIVLISQLALVSMYLSSVVYRRFFCRRERFLVKSLR